MFAAEFSGVDLRRPVPAAGIAEIVSAMDRYAVLVLPGQDIDDEQQIAFSRQLGSLSYALNHGRKVGQSARLRAELYDISNLDEKSDVLGMSDRRRQWREGDRLWHTDRSFIAADTTYSILSARTIPPEGGDTEFADMRAAYDALDEATKRRIEGLSRRTFGLVFACARRRHRFPSRRGRDHAAGAAAARAPSSGLEA